MLTLYLSSIADSPDVNRQLQRGPEERTIGYNTLKWSCPSPPLPCRLHPRRQSVSKFLCLLRSILKNPERAPDVVVVPENVGVVDQYLSIYIRLDAQTLILIDIDRS
jgi:hypothetical protein